MSSEPWGEGTPWKNQSQFMAYVRGAIRRAWMRHPVKLNVIKNSRYKIENPNPKGKVKQVWGFKCECCGGEFIQSEGQVDHINPAGSFNERDEIQGFVERLLFVREEDLRLICKSCNSALAMSFKQGISFEQALLEKQAIAFVKQPVEQQRAFFKQRGMDVPPSKEKRRKAFVDVLREEAE